MTIQPQTQNADNTGQQDLPAGTFSVWLRQIRSAQGNCAGVDVPCGECNACCRSSYFIHIRPEETETLARIPKKLLFKAPLMPKGHLLLGYNQNGCCPMWNDGQCSIYDQRPQTCRNYDCRIFPAAGILADEDQKSLIAQQIIRWKFSYPSRRDRDRHQAVQAAGQFLQEHAECFPVGFLPRNSTQLAMMAVKVYRVFLKNHHQFGGTQDLLSEPEIAQAVVKAYEKFEERHDAPKLYHP